MKLKYRLLFYFIPTAIAIASILMAVISRTGPYVELSMNIVSFT